MLLVYCLLFSIVHSYVGLYSKASSIVIMNSTTVFCEQDIVQFNCTVSSPGITFGVTQAGISINGSAMCYTATDVINLVVPRISYTNIGTNLSAPLALYTLSPYLLQDAVTSYRCCAVDDTAVLYYTDNITLWLAAPPLAANVSLSTAFVSSTSCTGTITLTWPAVTSDREVTSYEVLLNGTTISTTTPTAGTNTYTTSMMSLAGFTGAYTVRAISCAGSSVSNEVVFTPSPPLAANVSLSTAFVSSTNCTGTITLTWPAVTSDREVTSYEVLLNGTNISTTTPTAGQNNYTTGELNLLEHYTTYTVVATSCAGYSISDELVFTPTSPPSVATISLSTAYASSTSCTGTITLTWPAVSSDSEVTSYEVLLNGVNISTITPTAGANTYTTNMISLAGFIGNYTVESTNCAGSSVSDETLFTAPNPPGSFAINPSITCLYLTDEADVTITVGTVSSDRGTTRFTLYINNQLEDNTTNTANYNFNRIVPLPADNKISITMYAHSCAGSTATTVVSNTCVVTLPFPDAGIIGIVVGGFFLILIIIVLIALCITLIYFALYRKSKKRLVT